MQTKLIGKRNLVVLQKGAYLILKFADWHLSVGTATRLLSMLAEQQI